MMSDVSPISSTDGVIQFRISSVFLTNILLCSIGRTRDALIGLNCQRTLVKWR